MKPTSEGYYWLRQPNGYDGIVSIDRDGDRLEVSFIGDESVVNLSQIDGEWMGPITPPIDWLSPDATIPMPAPYAQARFDALSIGGNGLREFYDERAARQNEVFVIEEATDE